MKDTPLFLLKMDKNIKLKLKNLMTNFVTFGSDSYYQGLAKKTLSQFNCIYKNSNTKLYTSSDLTQEVLENAKKYRRGFGYYFWKPFVYNLMITESKDGEVSLYFDSRSGISDKFFDKFILKIKNELVQYFLKMKIRHCSMATYIKRKSLDYRRYF